MTFNKKNPPFNVILAKRDLVPLSLRERARREGTVMAK